MYEDTNLTTLGGTLKINTLKCIFSLWIVCPSLPELVLHFSLVFASLFGFSRVGFASLFGF
jgi:hypothetical protein